MQGELDIVEIILSSGLVVKAVLVLLIFCSILSFSIAWKKYNEFKNFIMLNEIFLNRFSELNELGDVLKSDNDQQNKNGPLYIVLNSCIKQIKKLAPSEDDSALKDTVLKHSQMFGFDFIERGLEQGEVRANQQMNNYLSTLASIGAISPFIGLFGTVWGIIDSFTGLASGGASLEAVAPGIAEALVATAVGLFAAIPAVYFFNYFNNKKVLINGQIDDFGKEFINFVERSLK